MGEEDDSNEKGSTGRGDTPRGMEADLAPAGTAVCMTAFRNVYLGLAAGEGFRFPVMDGSDRQGQRWGGSYAMLADGLRLFKGEKLTRSREVVTLQSPDGVPTISISTKYFHASDGGIFQIVFSSGVTYHPLSQSALPSLPKIGDSGILGTFIGSDTSTVTVTWEVKPAARDSAILELSSVVTGKDADTAIEVDRYLLDANGVPMTVTLSATSMGATVNLSGSKSDDRESG
jgi:hypothetical protein